MKQEYKNYRPEDFEVWKTLFSRQVINLQDKSCVEYLDALKEMDEVLKPDRIAEFEQLDKWFSTRTGWQIQCVPGLIPVDEFFELLAQKKFCSSTWLRSMEQLDYLEEPDMFHDIFGHIPLLSNEVFSAFIYEFGKLGFENIDNEERLLQLQRLYWFTIEFGLIEQNGVKIYGAGIASSFGEAISCLQTEAKHEKFDLNRVLNMSFETDKIQEQYIVIESFDQLYQAILELKEAWK